MRVPASLEQYLRSRGRLDLVARAESIQELPDSTFAQMFAEARVETLARGYNHEALRGRTAFGDTVFRVPWPETQRPTDLTVLEIAGALLWSAATDTEPHLPYALGPRGETTVDPYVPGTPLSTLIATGVAPLPLAALARLFRSAEGLLKEFGGTIDLLNPGNILVQATGEVRLVDLELLWPTPETTSWYLARGCVLPSRPRDFPVVAEWPLVPEWTALNTVWGLPLRESVQFIAELRGVDEAVALQQIAEAPTLRPSLNPDLFSSSNRQLATVSLTADGNRSSNQRR